MSVPIIRLDEPIGVISVARPEPTVFTDSQIQLLETFAQQAIIAMDNANLFEQVEAKTRELENLNRTLEARVEQQVNELERINL